MKEKTAGTKQGMAHSIVEGLGNQINEPKKLTWDEQIRRLKIIFKNDPEVLQQQINFAKKLNEHLEVIANDADTYVKGGFQKAIGKTKRHLDDFTIVAQALIIGIRQRLSEPTISKVNKLKDYLKAIDTTILIEKEIPSAFIPDLLTVLRTRQREVSGEIANLDPDIWVGATIARLFNSHPNDLKLNAGGASVARKLVTIVCDWTGYKMDAETIVNKGLAITKTNPHLDLNTKDLSTPLVDVLKL